MINYQKLFSKKSLIIAIFIAFAVFWFGNFMYAFLYMLVLPVILYLYDKNNSDIKDIAENHAHIVFSSIMIMVAYSTSLIHYLSVQNPNKVFDKNRLVIETYYLPEYKFSRTRSDGQLWVKNSKGSEAINCSAMIYGRCPHAYDYGKNIDIGFIQVRKNFFRAISGRSQPNIAYYIKFGNEVIPSEYFIKKYDDEMKRVYLFLLSLNLYMVFLYYIKKTYGINLRKSFAYVLSNKKDLEVLIIGVVIIAFYPIFFVFF